IFGPNMFFVVAVAFWPANEALHRGAKLHGLASAPISHADPSRILHRFAGFGFKRLLPMTRHHGGKGIEFEVEIRMTGGDHFVVNEFVFRTEMAFEAFFGAMNHVARVRHSQLNGFFMRPAGCSVRAEPTGSRTMAIFAGDAFGDFELAATLLGFGI